MTSTPGFGPLIFWVGMLLLYVALVLTYVVHRQRTKKVRGVAPTALVAAQEAPTPRDMPLISGGTPRHIGVYRHVEPPKKVVVSDDLPSEHYPKTEEVRELPTLKTRAVPPPPEARTRETKVDMTKAKTLNGDLDAHDIASLFVQDERPMFPDGPPPLPPAALHSTTSRKTSKSDRALTSKTRELHVSDIAEYSEHVLKARNTGDGDV